MKYIQQIQIGRNVTDIMRLECVYSCHKEADGRLCYPLYDWDKDGNYIAAHEGDTLCQSEDGKWHVEKKK